MKVIGLGQFISNPFLFFDTTDEALSLYRQYSKNPTLSNSIRKDAFDYVQKYHSWNNRCSDIIEILKDKKDKFTFLYKEIYDNKYKKSKD